MTPSPSHVTDDPSSQQYLLHLSAIRLTDPHRSQKHPQFLANSPSPTAYQHQTGVNLVLGCLHTRRTRVLGPQTHLLTSVKSMLHHRLPKASPGTKFYAKGLKSWRCTPPRRLQMGRNGPSTSVGSAQEDGWASTFNTRTDSPAGF